MTLKGIAAAALVLGTATAFAAEGGAPTDITAAERAKGMYFMEAANRKLFAAVEGLTPEQWNFKSAPDRWSVAETLEHLTIIQDVVLGILAKLNTGAVAPAGRDLTSMDAEIIANVADRSEKYKAPPQAIPAARWTPAEALAHYRDSNAKLRAALETRHDLRAHVSNHPIFGPWDGYQWILGAAGHTSRHTDQIFEIKATAGFPVSK